MLHNDNFENNEKEIEAEVKRILSNIKEIRIQKTWGKSGFLKR